MSQRKCGQSLSCRETAVGRQEEQLYLRNCRGGSQRMHEPGRGDEAVKVDRGQMMKLDDISRGLDSTV